MSWANTGLLSSLQAWVSRTTSRSLFLGFILGFSFSWSFKTILQRRKQERHIPHFSPKPIELRSDEIVHGVTGLIGERNNTLTLLDFTSEVTGNTPLVRINSLSDALGVEILGKAEVSKSIKRYEEYPFLRL